MPVYFIQATNDLIKIGYINSIKALGGRLAVIESNSPLPLVLLGVIPNNLDDRVLHGKFAHLRHHGEWFTSSPELLEYITQNSIQPEIKFGNNQKCKGVTLAGKPCRYVVRGGDEYCSKHQTR